MIITTIITVLHTMQAELHLRPTTIIWVMTTACYLFSSWSMPGATYRDNRLISTGWLFSDGVVSTVVGFPGRAELYCLWQFPWQQGLVMRRRVGEWVLSGLRRVCLWSPAQWTHKRTVGPMPLCLWLKITLDALQTGLSAHGKRFLIGSLIYASATSSFCWVIISRLRNLRGISSIVDLIKKPV